MSLPQAMERVTAQGNLVNVNFSRYPDGTPVSSFREKYVAFAVNGNARVNQQHLQIDPGTSVLIKLGGTANHIVYTYNFTDVCVTASATITFYKQGKVSAQNPLVGASLCTGRIDEGEDYDALVIAVNGPSTQPYKLEFLNLFFTFVSAPQPIQTAALPTPLPAPTLALAPTQSAADLTKLVLYHNALVNDLNGQSLSLFANLESNAPLVEKLPHDTLVTLTNGPTNALGSTWWHVATEWGTGWVMAKVTLDGKPYQSLLPVSDSLLQQRVAAYTSALTNPKDATGYANLAQAYRNNHDWDRARQMFVQALNTDPTNTTIAYQFAQMLLKMYEESPTIAEYSAQALTQFNMLIQLDSKRAAFYGGRALVYDSVAKWDAALADNTQAIALNPNNAAAYNNRGVDQWRLHNDVAAIADYNQALKIDPYSPDPYYNLGTTYLDAGQAQAAISILNQSIKVVAASLGAYQKLAGIYAENGDFKNAQAICTKALAIDPQASEAHSCQGLVYVLQGKRDDALKEYDLAVKFASTPSESHKALFGRGTVYYELGKSINAMQDLSLALQFDPFDVNNYLNLGYAYAGENEYDAAIKTYTKGLDIAPGTNSLLINRCMAYALQQQVDLALADCTVVLQNNPNNYLALYWQAVAHSVNVPDYPKAVVELKQAIVVNSTFPDAYAQLGHVYLLQNDLTQAKAMYKRYLQFNQAPDGQTLQDLAVLKIPPSSATAAR